MANTSSPKKAPVISEKDRDHLVKLSKAVHFKGAHKAAIHKLELGKVLKDTEAFLIHELIVILKAITHGKSD